MSNPFLLCIPIEKLGNAIEILEDWQAKHHGRGLGLLSQLEAKVEPVHIDAPDYEEMEAIEVSREISRAPSHVARIK